MAKQVKVRPIRVTKHGAHDSVAQNMVILALNNSGVAMQRWLAEHGRVATGKTINSFKIDIKNKRLKNFKASNSEAQGFVLEAKRGSTSLAVKGTLLAAPHLDSVLYGRGPGKMPPRYAIRTWLRAKGIKSVRYNERELTFLVARKIGREGTDPPFAEKQFLRNLTIPNVRNIIKRSMPYFQDENLVPTMKRIFAAANLVEQVGGYVKFTSSFGGKKGKVNLKGMTKKLKTRSRFPIKKPRVFRDFNIGNKGVDLPGFKLGGFKGFNI